jgi:hypothetical protein
LLYFYKVRIHGENSNILNVRYSYGLNPQLRNAILQLFKNRIIMIQLHDKNLFPFISAKEIEFAITKMVQQVEDDFIDETPYL